MPKVELRHQRVSDAKRYFEILTNPNFIYWDVRPSSIQDEANWLRKNPIVSKKNFAHNFAILFDGKLVGGCGIKIDLHRNYIGEIGFFVDEAHWGKGIATEAVKQLEKIGFDKLSLVRIEIWMDPRNIPSEKVALKCGYHKEGIMKKSQKHGSGFVDSNLYAKVK